MATKPKLLTFALIPDSTGMRYSFSLLDPTGERKVAIAFGLFNAPTAVTWPNMSRERLWAAGAPGLVVETAPPEILEAVDKARGELAALLGHAVPREIKRPDFRAGYNWLGMYLFTAGTVVRCTLLEPDGSSSTEMLEARVTDPRLVTRGQRVRKPKPPRRRRTPQQPG